MASVEVSKVEVFEKELLKERMGKQPICGDLVSSCIYLFFKSLNNVYLDIDYKEVKLMNYISKYFSKKALKSEVISGDKEHWELNSIFNTWAIKIDEDILFKIYNASNESTEDLYEYPKGTFLTYTHPTHRIIYRSALDTIKKKSSKYTLYIFVIKFKVDRDKYKKIKTDKKKTDKTFKPFTYPSVNFIHTFCILKDKNNDFFLYQESINEDPYFKPILLKDWKTRENIWKKKNTFKINIDEFLNDFLNNQYNFGKSLVNVPVNYLMYLPINIYSIELNDDFIKENAFSNTPSLSRKSSERNMADMKSPNFSNTPSLSRKSSERNMADMKSPFASGGKRCPKKPRKTRKHKGIIQTGGNNGRLRKGYKYSGKKLKSGLPQIIKCKSKYKK